MSDKIIETFGNKLRVRVSGVLIQDNKILLVKHTSLGKKRFFWSPPGGGLSFGESTEECLKREFLEETGLKVVLKDFLCVHEYLHPPLHAIELFFHVESGSSAFIKGLDPELSSRDQIIQEVRFFTLEEILALDPETIHKIATLPGIFTNPEKLRGFYTNKTPKE